MVYLEIVDLKPRVLSLELTKMPGHSLLCDQHHQVTSLGTGNNFLDLCSKVNDTGGTYC